ncbi:MAG: 2-oxoacid:acceptor oxidoreductase family protein [Desulfatiglandales bacterium]
MLEIRLHGRGGQGAVTCAELLATAAINSGKYGQAFPSFGPERRGAPVVAFLRIDDKPIKIRSNINEPDMVLVLDPSILRIVDVTAGLKKGGILVANSRYDPKDIRNKLNLKCKLAVVDATHIAREELGVPVTNTTMVGALLKAQPFVDPDFLVSSIKERFGAMADRNVRALRRAFDETKPGL